MWKYVSRRIRDTLERTYNVLETQRTWTCGGNGGEKGPNSPNNHPTTTNYSTSSSTTTNDDDECQQYGRVGPIYTDSFKAQQHLKQQQQQQQQQQQPPPQEPYVAGYTAWTEKWRTAQENLKKDHHFFEYVWNERWHYKNARNIRGQKQEDLSAKQQNEDDNGEKQLRNDRRKFKFSKYHCPLRERFNKRRFNDEQQQYQQYRKRNCHQRKQSICTDEGYSSSSSGGKEDNFKRDHQDYNYNCNYKKNYLGAITWSSAIICGWYTSQILCMKRRHLREGIGWHGLCKTPSSTSSSIRSVHSNVLSHLVLATPYYYSEKRFNQQHTNNFTVIGRNDVDHNEKSLSKTKLWFDTAFYDNNNKNQFYEKDIQKYLFQISNDFTGILPIGGVNNNNFGKDNNKTIYVNEDITPIKETIKSDAKTINHEKLANNTITPPKTTTTVNDAVQELLKVIGDIEYQLGVQSIENQEYDSAVTHFKLGTSHHHMNATFNLGVCYELGLGVKCDLKMAFECYQIASSMGHAKATYNVAIFHAKGLGGAKKNRRLARQLFVDAARLGQIDAINSINLNTHTDKTTQQSMGNVIRSSTIGQPHIAANKQYGQESAIYIQQAVA